jgi:CubicO group peptidase (beta-lactamase class C family)
MHKLNFPIVNVLLLAFVLTGCDQPARIAEPTERGRQATDIIARRLEANPLPGLAVSISHYGFTVYSQGFGYADLEQHVPIKPDQTKFRIGSVSKPLSVFALAKLIEQGRIDLDAPIQTYVPSFPVKPEGAITVPHLAGHLAGIRHYRGDEFLSLTNYTNVIDGLTIFQDDTLLHPPGHKYAYSSYGYNLLSAVIEAAADEPFLDHMQRVVFDALELRQTTADHVTPLVPYRTRYYEREGDRFINAPPVDNSYKWAGGGFLSTSEDLLKFANAHLSGEHLKPETIELLWTPQTQNADGKSTGYGIGWRSQTDANGRHTVGHTGGSVGGTTVLRIYPEHQLVIALISNQSSAPMGDLTDHLASVYLND